MNLKEAFRFQNKLQSLITQVTDVLATPANVVNTEQTHLRKKVNPDAEDETIIIVPKTEYADKITDLTKFLMFLLNEREKLSTAIRKTKKDLPIDLDGETGLNSLRQNILITLRGMDSIRANEVIYPDRGTGYRFNADGNQVSYHCDLKQVTTINFDRNVIRNYIKDLDKKTNETSTTIDQCVINSKVDYEEPFNVNESLFSIFENWTDIVS